MITLRQSLRQKRRTISAPDRRKYSQKLALSVQKNCPLNHVQKIAIYSPNDFEIDTKYIIKFLKNQGFSIYLPVLVGRILKFAKIGKRFKKNKFGIYEPISTQILSPNQMNIIFMPLVGFDKHKNRLGVGAGFYDRTLAFKKRQQNYKNPTLYGLAFNCQEINQLNPQPWDVPLDGIITPTRYFC